MYISYSIEAFFPLGNKMLLSLNISNPAPNISNILLQHREANYLGVTYKHIEYCCSIFH